MPAPDAADDAGRIEAVVLECVAGMTPAIGVGKVVEVVTGSKSSWIERTGANELTCYGAVSADRKSVTGIIHGMIEHGLLRRTGDRRYPVLELTAAGEKVLQRTCAGPALLRPAPEEEPAPARQSPAQHLDELLKELLVSDRDRALALVQELKTFHPREIVSRLGERLASGSEDAIMRRIVWVLGEAGEERAVPHLVRCADSPDAGVRRLTVLALGKLIEAGHIIRQDETIRAVLGLLLKDSVPEVRQDAQRALAQLSPER
jgi:HEAT repeat protein